MEAFAQSPGGAVYISPESITLGRYGFDARRVQAARVWPQEPRRDALRFLPMLFASLIFTVSLGFEDGVFSWSKVLNPFGIIMVVLLAIALPTFIALALFRENTVAYIVQLKRDGVWTNAWATLDQAAAHDVAMNIRRSMSGEQVNLSLPGGFGREGNMLLFGNQSFPIQWVSTARRIPRPADSASEFSSLLIGTGFLLMSVRRLLEAITGPDSPFQWLILLLVVAALFFMLRGLVPGPGMSMDRNSRYVHLVQLRGTFGRRLVYASVDQAEADGIVANINRAIAANKTPQLEQTC
jgi:hypothetical protein